MAKKAYIGVKALPDGYTLLEYIQSSGTQYINTGFKPNNNTRVVCDFQLLNSGVGQSVFGAWAFDSNYAVDNAYLLQVQAENYFTYWHGDGASQDFSSSISVTGRHVCDANKNVGAIDKSNTVTVTASTFSSDYPLYLFGGNFMNSLNQGTAMRLWSTKIYDNGTLIRSYVPCINPQGTIGLYDSVNSSFYGNAGSGAFVAGTTLASTAVAREIKKGYLGVNGVARKLKSGYVGVGGVAREFLGEIDYAQMFKTMSMGGRTGRNSSSGSYVSAQREAANPYFICAWNGHMGVFYTSGNGNEYREPIFTMADSYGWVCYATRSNTTAWYLGNKDGYNTMSGGTIAKGNFSDGEAIRQFFVDYYLAYSAFTNGTNKQVYMTVSDATEGDVIFAFYGGNYAISIYQNGSWVALTGEPYLADRPCLFEVVGKLIYLRDRNASMYGGNMFLFRKK